MKTFVTILLLDKKKPNKAEKLSQAGPGRLLVLNKKKSCYFDFDVKTDREGWPGGVGTGTGAG